MKNIRPFSVCAMAFFFSFSVLAQTTITTNKDCAIHNATPNTNLNGIFLIVENQNQGDPAGASLIYFNLSTIPQNVTIESANLYLYCFEKNGSPVLRIGRLETKSWTETDVTWNNMPYMEQPPEVTYHSVGPKTTFTAYSVTEFVRGWYSHTYVNNGFQLFTETDQTNATFYAREGGTSYAPYLVVDYITGVEPLTSETPLAHALYQNYPNPFNPTTTISYQLPTQSHVTLKIFNVLGREIATLVNAEQAAGYKSVTWNATNIPSGMYFYRLSVVLTAQRDLVPTDGRNGQAGTYTETKKLLLIK